MDAPNKSARNPTFLDKLTFKIIICALMMIAIIHPLPLYGIELGANRVGVGPQRGGAPPIAPVPIVPSLEALDAERTSARKLAWSRCNNTSYADPSHLMRCHPDSIPADGGRIIIPLPMPKDQLTQNCQRIIALCIPLSNERSPTIEGILGDFISNCGQRQGVAIRKCKASYFLGLDFISNFRPMINACSGFLSSAQAAILDWPNCAGFARQPYTPSLPSSK